MTFVTVNEMTSNSGPQKAVLVVGILLILFGLIANQWVLTYLFSDDRYIEYSGKLIIIWAIDFLSIATGIWVITCRTNVRVAALSINILVLIGSSVIVILILELTFPLIQRSIPVEVRNYIPWPYSLLSQSTKKSHVPRDYMAIFGDSYAEGSGDLFTER